LTDKHRQFLVGLANAQPEWPLLACPYASELPALRWKLANLQVFAKARPKDFQSQAIALESELE
jgi:hypothetical protein